MEDWRNDLIVKNKPLVYFCFQRFIQKTNFSITYKDDIISEGFVGLCKAAKNYNPDLNVKFVTYATKLIVTNMLLYIRDNKKIVERTIMLEDFATPVSIGISEDATLLNQVVDYLRKTLSDKSFKIFQMWLSGVPQVEIAKTVGCTPQNISTLIRKISEKVKRKFTE